MQNITVLGSTGSIGKSTLDVIARHRDRYQVYALAANKSHALMLAQCRQFNPIFAYLEDPLAAQLLRTELSNENLTTKVLESPEDLVDISSNNEVDTVVAGIVGAAGLMPTLAAVSSGKKILLANKESLVMAGQLFMNEVERSSATLIPIDSEHNAIFQCLPYQDTTRIDKTTVSKLVLTASGGPFRKYSKDSMALVTPEQACNHPNWSMGKKISVDSATMMNKGLELIEAHWLFDVQASLIDVVIHPQSIIHSMVQYIDGSTLAQLGNPDMKVPIAHALAWPDRIDSGISDIDLLAIGRLDFEAADENRFPCLRLAREACDIGLSAATVLNAANEIGVEAFLNEQISFNRIAEINEEVLQRVSLTELSSVDVVLEIDATARYLATNLL